jgi:hypothetical protein
MSLEEVQAGALNASIIADLTVLYPTLCLRLRAARPSRKVQSRGVCVALRRILGTKKP